MSPIHDTTTPEGTDPFAVLEHLARWLAQATAHVALGGLLGLLAAHAMRRRHLHWSWAAGAVPPLLLAPAAVAGPAFTAALAGLVAAVRGRRWHHEDLRAGADLAEVAVRRTTPLDAVGAVVRAGRAWLRLHRPVRRMYARLLGGRLGRRLLGGRRLGVRVLGGGVLDCLPGGRRLRELRPCGGGLLGRLLGRRPEGVDELRVGDAARGRPVSIELGGVGGVTGGGTHTLVAGATGSGKTVTLTWIVTQAVTRGMAAVVVDPKGDRWARERLRHAAAAAGRRFLAWTPEGPAVYNPYGHGGATEIADKALAGERFTEPHYLRQAQRYLGHAVRALRAAGAPVSLATLVRALDPEELEVLARQLVPERAAAVHAYLDSLTPRQRADLTGVRDRLAIVAESDVGHWLDPAAGGGSAEALDLLAAVRAGAVVYFDLRADSRPLLARMVAGAVVGDLQTVVSALQEHPARCVVAIDEFSAVAVEQVAGLFGRARSAGVSLVLGTQELADLRVPGHEHLREQVLGNLTTLIAHRQVVPESAELVARLSGTAGAWRTTVASDGRSTRTRVAVPAIDAEEAMSLPRGCAAVLRLAGPRRAAIARMSSPDRG